MIRWAIIPAISLFIATPAILLAASTTAPATNSSSVQVEQLSPPAPKTQIGDTLFVIYTGKLANGRIFDTNAGGQLFRFTLGTGQVIKGWDKGLVGAEIGEKLRLIVPPSLAYGSEPHGSIPADSTLYFDVQIVGIVRMPR